MAHRNPIRNANVLRCRPRPLAQSVAQAFARPAWGAGMLALLGSLGLPALAGPQGAQVVAGQATVQQSGPVTTVHQTTQRAIIDWRSFNVGANETVRFQQPSSQAATLNRVLGNDPSAIFGRVEANGQLFLVNPNGIVFGRTARVDVGALVASTANVSNTDFMAGRLNFSQPGKAGAQVVNEGEITVAEGGLAALVGPSVSNRGLITAKLAKVALAAGEAFTLDLRGDQLIQLVVPSEALSSLTDAAGRPLAALLDHSGQIAADGGFVLLTAATASRLMDSLINVSGGIRATTASATPGRISLRGDAGTRLTLSGSLDASGDRGGRIEVTAREVDLASGARLDASGLQGGGTVSVGGDWQGRGALPNAHRVDVATGVSIDASARERGDGGTVVIWSDGDTRFAGKIESRGGVAGGHGGQVEVSGKGRLGFEGDVDASAAKGRAGSLLLDPTNITIAATGGAIPGASSTGDFTVGVNSVRRVLLSGTSVEMTATNDITVAAAIDGRSTGGGTPGGGLRLEAGRNIALNQNIILNNGNLNLQAGGTLTQAPAALLFTGTGAMNLSGSAGVQLGQLITNGGSVRVASAQGSVVVNAPIVGEGASGRAGALDISGAGVQLAGARAASADLRTNGAQALQLSGTLDVSGALSLRSGGTVTVGDVNGATVQLRGAGGVETRAGGLVVNGRVVATGTVDLRSAGDVAVREGAGLRGSDLRIDTSGRLNTAAAQGNTAAASLLSAAGATLTAGELALAGSLGTAGATTLTATGLATLTGGVTVSGTGGLVITAQRVLQTGEKPISSGAGNLSVSATGGALTATRLLAEGDITLSAPQGAVSVAAALVGPAPDATTLVSAGKLSVLGQQVQLAGGRFRSGADVSATAGTLQLTDTLQLGGALRLASSGAVTMKDINATSVQLAGDLNGQGLAGSDVAFNGNVASAGAVTVKATGAVQTTAGTKIAAAGPVDLLGRSIFIAAGLAATPADAGVRVSGTTNALSLTATGAGADGVAVSAQGLLSTGGGALTVLAQQAGQVDVREVSGFGSGANRASLTATQGSLTLSRAYGGELALTTVAGTGSAARDVVLTDEAALSNGLTVRSAGSFTQAETGKGLLRAGSGSIDIEAAQAVTLLSLVSDGGAVRLQSTSGAVTVASPIVGPGTAGRTGALTVSAKGLTLNGGRVAGFTLTNTDAAQALRLQGSLDATGTGQVLSAGAVSLADVTAAGFTLAGLAGTAAADSAADSLNLSGSLTTTGAALVEMRTVNALNVAAAGGIKTAGALRLRAGGALVTAAGSAIVAAGPATLTSGSLSIGGGLQAGGAGNTELTATSQGITLGDAAVVKVVGAGKLIFDGTGFTQAAGSKAQSGEGGITVRAGSGNVAATALVSPGSVSLSGADITVTEAMVGPDTATATAALLMVQAAGQATLAGGRFAGAVDITATTPSTATRGGITLNGTLLAGGALRMATDGSTSLQAVKAASVSLADTLVSTTGRAGGDLVLRGDVDSAGSARFGVEGAFSTDANVKLASAGALGIEAASIFVRGGSGTGVRADAAGLSVAGTSSMSLTATGGDVTTGPGSPRPALLAEGSLRTAGGNLTLKATGSGSIRLSQLQTVASRPDNSTESRSSLNGVLDVESAQGSVVLTEALGGDLTGYASYADGYVARNRPLLGAVSIRAATGIETNGLNLDGTQAPGTGAAGEAKGLSLKLTGTTPGVIIVNQTLAVNKGAIDIDAGSGDVLIGASIYSRGYDMAEAGRTATSVPPAVGAANNTKVAYEISVKGSKLAFWDSDLGMAILPVTDPVRGLADQWLVGKITVANNAANYSDSGNTGTLVPVRAATAPSVSLIGVFEGLNTAPGSSLRLGAAQPARVALSQVPNLASITGEATGQTSGRGLAVKVLTYKNAGDVGSDLSQARPVCADPGQGDNCFSSGAAFSLDLNSVVVGNSASGAKVTDGSLQAGLSSNYERPINPNTGEPSSGTAYNGIAALRNVLVVVVTGEKDLGSRTVFFPDIVATQSKTGVTETGGDRDNSATTTLPSNSSITPFGAIGGFGAVQTQNLAVIVSSAVSSLNTIQNVTTGQNAGSPNAIQAPQPVNPLTFRADAPGTVIPGSQLLAGEVPGAPGPIVETAVEAPRQDLLNLPGPLYSLVTRADLGRGGALGGAASVVFGMRVLLGASSDPKICAPGDFAAEGAAAASCKPR